MESKAELRARLNAQRNALSEEARQKASYELRSCLLARTDIQETCRARTPIAGYLATHAELSLSPTLFVLHELNAVLAVPYWDAPAKLYRLSQFSSHTKLVEGPHGIFQPAHPKPITPSEIALWLVPCVGMTRAGARLGYGGGWYDRFFAACAPQVPRMGVGYDFQVLDELPLEKHDVGLTDVVSVSSKG